MWYQIFNNKFLVCCHNSCTYHYPFSRIVESALLAGIEGRNTGAKRIELDPAVRRQLPVFVSKNVLRAFKVGRNLIS